MPVNDVPRLLSSAKSGSTAAPLELFIQIHEAIHTLMDGAPLVAPTVSVRAPIHAAYLHLVPSEARARKPYTTFLSIGAAAMRHLLKHEAETHLDRAPIQRSPPSFHTLKQLLHNGAALKPRHWSALLALDEALTQLGRQPSQAAEILEGRFFGQMSDDELTLAFTLPPPAVQNNLSTGTIWLRQYEASGHSSAARRAHPPQPQS